MGLASQEGQMTDAVYLCLTGEGRTDFRAACDAVTAPAWPEFMHHDPVARRHWRDLYDDFPQFQFALADPVSGEFVAVGGSVPLHWPRGPAGLPEEGWDWALAQGAKDRELGRRPNLLCALFIVVPERARGAGVSPYAVRAMKVIAKGHGLSALVVPARPTLKCRYPLTTMERYVAWTTGEGLPFDPWLRVHARLGAEILGPCLRSMTITGTVAEWERWTGMRFPESGRYVLPEALVPVSIDREADTGTYVEPNVWLKHELDRGR